MFNPRAYILGKHDGEIDQHSEETVRMLGEAIDRFRMCLDSKAQLADIKINTRIVNQAQGNKTDQEIEVSFLAPICQTNGRMVF